MMKSTALNVRKVVHHNVISTHLSEERDGPLGYLAQSCPFEVKYILNGWVQVKGSGEAVYIHSGKS